MIPQPVLSILCPLEGHGPKDPCFDDQFQGYESTTSSDHLGYVDLGEAPLRAHGSSS